MTISDPAEIITGAQIYSTSAPSIGAIGDVLEFQSNTMTSSLGHLLECRYDWDDGTFSDWLPQSGFTPSSHAWSAVGVYQVRVMARCIEHPAAESAWSGAHELEYQLSYGTDYDRVNDFPQGWTTAENLSITWDTVYAHNFVIVTARCIEHPDVEASSSYMVVNIGN